jgi:hypothetical protein
MSAILVAIQRCIDEGWYAKLRKGAPFWLGDFPIDPPELQTELSRCATLPNKDDVRLRALLAVWQLPPWGPPWGSADLEREAQVRKSAWVSKGLSPTSGPGVPPPSDPVARSVETDPPIDEAALPEPGYPRVRLALLRFTSLLWESARRLSALHRSGKHAEINKKLIVLAQRAGLVERPRRGKRKRLPKPEHLRELECQTAWLVSQVNEWSSRAEAFVEKTQRVAEGEAERLAKQAGRIAKDTKRRAGERERLAMTVRTDLAKMDERLAATETPEVRANLALMDELGSIRLNAERAENNAIRSAEWAMMPVSSSPAATTPAPTRAPSAALSLDDAWAIRFPLLTRDERRALLSRDYQREARKYSVADWLMARRLRFNATAIRQQRAKAKATDDRPSASGRRDDS